MRARKGNASQHVLTKTIYLCWPKISCASEHTKYISTCVAHILRCLWIHKIYLNFCWPYLSHDSEDTNYISTCVDHNPLDSEERRCKPSKPIPCQRGNKKYLYLCWTKPLPCLQKHKIFLKLCWINTTNANEDKKYMLRHLLTKPMPCQQWHKRHPHMFCLNTSHASEDIKCPMPSKTSR